MEKEEIQDKIDNIINTVIENILPQKETLSPTEKLGLILGESLQALFFVTTLEDEFDIVFEDEEIDLDFFRDIDNVTNKIYLHLVRA